MHVSLNLLLSMYICLGTFFLITPICVLAATKCVTETKAAPKHEGIVFDQYYLACLSEASYLIGDMESKEAILVDPIRDVDQYFKDAEARGLKITHVILTHVHADFVAGHLEVQKRNQAKICMGSKAEASFAFEKLKDGETIKLGRLAIKIWETPGHTPESISLLVYDRKVDSQNPYAVLTGDCLFIGDVGRPDLMEGSGITAKELAGMEYDSLRNKLMTLPDETLVYPAHGAGSLCGKNLSKETVSTIGEQKRSNYALQPMGKEKFVELITANQPKAPSYWQFERDMNLKPHKTLDETVIAGLKALKLEDALGLKNKGAQLLDVREMDEYASKHVKDTVNIALSGHYAMWAGNFLNSKTPIVLICNPGKEKEAVSRLGRIGFDNVAGYVDGGISAFDTKQELIESDKRETALSLSDRLSTKTEAPLVLDIRNDSERQESYIDGSLQIPLIVLLDNMDKLPKDKDIVVQCATGFRSSIAASLLRQRGFTRVNDLAGGITAWKEAKLPFKGSGSCSTAASSKAAVVD